MIPAVSLAGDTHYQLSIKHSTLKGVQSQREFLLEGLIPSTFLWYNYGPPFLFPFDKQSSSHLNKD